VRDRAGSRTVRSGLSAYQRRHINVHGHYSFTLPDLGGARRDRQNPQNLSLGVPATVLSPATISIRPRLTGTRPPMVPTVSVVGQWGQRT
jgi:hypothetical protein